MAEDPDPTVSTPAHVAGDYRLLRTLGAGGFGIVFEARHTKTDLPYAVKRLQLTEEDAERFQKEALYPARAAGQSLHVLGVQSFFRDDRQGYFYLVTELMPHGDLRRFLATQGKPLPLALALDISLGVARGLAAIHDQGVIHRDLKPANILMDQKDGRWVPKIADFGLARSGASLSEGGFASPGYAAPEQLDFASDDPPGADSDAFSLGSVLYEVLTGQKVTTATDIREYARWLRARQPPERPSRIRPELAAYPEIDAVVMSLMEFDRSRRLSSASQVIAALGRVLQQVQSQREDYQTANQTPIQPTPGARTPAWYRPAAVGALFAAVVAFSTGLAWLLFYKGSTTAATAVTKTTDAESLIGCWSYNSLLMTVTADGKVTGFLEGGRWASSGEHQYVITWPRSVDVMTLSSDGRSMSGRNNYAGPGVAGIRAAGDSASVAGQWQWTNGQPTVFHEDGSVTNGPVAGRWTRVSDNTIRIVWEYAFVDRLTLAPDGRSISGKNQLGVAVGGTRVPCAPG
jgi:tRNA A-37 threonylcarbamoyl transferase component Bud32